ERLTEISRPAALSASISTFEALAQLANLYVTNYIDTSKRSDDMLRKKLGVFVSAKRSQTANLITQLMHISKLQSTIANIPLSLSNLDDSLRKRDSDFGQLVLVQRIPIAYGALLVEIVRRREYSKLLLQKSQQLAEVLSRFKQQEQRRRDSFRSDIAKFVPVVVPGLDDVAPFCEVNALNTRDRLPPFTREHVTEFEKLISQLSIGLGSPEGNESHVLGLEQSSIGASSISSGQEGSYDALSKLRVTLSRMTAQMDVMSSEFDRILEKSFLTDRVQKLEEENARLRADMSRVDIQQRSGTPQLGQNPRLGTPVGGVGASVAQGSATTGTTGGLTVTPSSSSKMSRQPSRGNSTSSTHRTDTDEQQHVLQQHVQRNQRLTKEITDLNTKTKAYEARIRSLEDTLYRNYGAGAESSVSSKNSRQQVPSLDTDQSWKTPEDIQVAPSQSLAKEQERKQEEERLLSLEQDLQRTFRKLEEAEARIQDQSKVETELRQELLELKLHSAALETSEESKALDVLAIQQRSEELDAELRGMILKHEGLLQHNEKEKELRALETKGFDDRIEELANQSRLEKENMEGQMDQVRRAEKQALEKVTELENELVVVNEELQNKVLELEEEVENHAARFEETATLMGEQERQLRSHQAVHDDILIQLKDQEKRAIEAIQMGKKAKEDYKKLLAVHVALETGYETLTKTHVVTQGAKDELAQQVETLLTQISELELQREVHNSDVNLRLEQAKTMLQRAEGVWKEKSGLLNQMERATKDLARPIQDCMDALGKRLDQSETANLVQVRELLLEIGQGILAIINQHKAELTELQKRASRESEESTGALKLELEAATTHAKELQSVRLSLSTLSLDLGIRLAKLSATAEDPQEANYPTSSVLWEKSEKRSKSASTLISPFPVHQASTSSTVVPSSSGTSRSLSATIPLSKSALQTFDFSDLNVTEMTAQIKKKVFDTEHLLKKWQRECKHLREKYNSAAAEAHEKIAVRNFKINDLTLFLPTRNSVSKPWAAFNINFPHYFLQMTPTMTSQLRNREWIVARINSIAEAVVDKRLETEDESSSSSTAVSSHNPFGLADGVKYYLLEATSWNGYHGQGKAPSSGSRESSSSSSSSKMRQVSSSGLLESSRSSRRDQDRSKERKDREKDKDQDTESRKHRDGGLEEEDGSQLKMIKEENSVSSEQISDDFSRTIASLQQTQSQILEKRTSLIHSDSSRTDITLGSGAVSGSVPYLSSVGSSGRSGGGASAAM
ncbi:oligomeric, coiled-coil, peripheral membrane protein, partial [Modicella reniformis]